VLNLEKSARIKFQVPMAPERKTRVLSNIYTEIEVILEKMNKEYQPLFAPLKQEEALQARVEKMRVNANENIDKQVAKLTEALDKELTAGRKIPPNELTRLY
ncbi:MAG: hypothetical protein GWM98_30050, partial [Nitrospinaceae bacterium]|nr:hypothetical protein [Nitrospinaceae bacterium]NIR57932.1 hypothetical protein [Nitrospinaceae bacterium]NIS88392.1 hypothetical protein [Nitrospinaceae bacterium]NIT85268.1 hypothetical protein [Nitrospinaceae bacterium]NIU47423.1 hypothetical protein [Nitrospinaceae bacterium]